jgi:hypothetical protein
VTGRPGCLLRRTTECLHEILEFHTAS